LTTIANIHIPNSLSSSITFIMAILKMIKSTVNLRLTFQNSTNQINTIMTIDLKDSSELSK